jgi:hypothetical protein
MPEWEDDVKKLWLEHKQSIIASLANQYGAYGIEQKINNYVQLGREAFSVIAFHNKFLNQSRNAFVIGSYYPALTGSCALGERILNHLVLRLRAYHKNSASYKKVHDKKSFDNWDVPIGVLEEWQVFLDGDVFQAWKDFVLKRVKRTNDDTTDLQRATGVADLFRKLQEIRNTSIHFRADLDQEVREPALRALHLLQDIVSVQFGVEGPLPWFISGVRGCTIIKKEFENIPFIKEFYLPACTYVGPKFKIEVYGKTFQVNDPGPYEDVEISDEQFADLLNEARNSR